MTADSGAGRLTVVCSRFRPERYGGVEERLWHVTQTFAAKGVAIDVLTENRLNAPARETFAPGLNVFRFPSFDPGRMWRWFHLAYVLYWYRVLKRHRPTGLLWVTDPMMAVAAVLAGHRRNLIFNPAACAAGMSHIGRLYPDVTTMQLPRVLEWIDRFAYRQARAVIVSSENVKQQFGRFYGSRAAVHVGSYGVVIPERLPARCEVRQRLGISFGAFVVGFVGRLDPCKGVDYLFEAAAHMGFEAEDRLLIIGDGEDQKRLLGIAARRGISEQVVWTGRVNDPASLMTAMDVLVLPSVYEAFGLVLLEAMAAGIPVIGRARDADSVFVASADIIQDGVTGFVVDGGPELLAQRLSWLRQHKPETEEMGRHALADAKRRDWDTLIEHYLEVLPELRDADLSRSA
jgi:glycosyltransferase involved in cell wall biosynthesis